MVAGGDDARVFYGFVAYQFFKKVIQITGWVNENGQVIYLISTNLHLNHSTPRFNSLFICLPRIITFDDERESNQYR